MRGKKYCDYYVDWPKDFMKHRKLLKNKSGIYCYFYKGNGVCLYVGATKDLYTRALRYIRNTDLNAGLTLAIMDSLGSYNLSVEVFFYPIKTLAKYEEIYKKKYKPICQVLDKRFYHPYKKMIHKG